MRFIAVFKDDPDAVALYYGPYVSQTIAEEFLANLPDPLSGGLKTFKMLQPFTSSEHIAASERILALRSKPPQGELSRIVGDMRSHMRSIKANPLVAHAT